MAWATYSSYKRPYTKNNWRYSSSWKAASPYRYKRYGSKARTLGNSYSARQQADSTQVVINRLVEVSIPFPANTRTGGTFVNIWQQLFLSSFYPNYSPMYDQVKLDGVRAKINGTVQGNNVSSYLTPTVVTAWDRNGVISSESASNISTYSSAVSKPWSLGNAFVQYRDIYAKTMSEKSQYVSTQSLATDYTTDTNNPAYPGQVQSIPWKPQLLIEVLVPTGATLGGNTIVFNVELDITVTFRGLRKGASTGDSGTVNLPITIDTLLSNGQNYSLSTAGTSTGSVTIPANTTLVVFASNTEMSVSSYTSALTISVTTGFRYLLLANGGSSQTVYPITTLGTVLPGIRDTLDSTTPVPSYYILPSGWSFVF